MDKDELEYEKDVFFSNKYKKLRQHYNSINFLKLQLKKDTIKYNSVPIKQSYLEVCYRKLQQERIEFAKEVENLYETGELDLDYKPLNTT